VGLAVGVGIGCTAWLFKFINHYKHAIWLKAIYCTAFAIGFTLAGDLSTYSNAKYLACQSFGYVCNRFWGNNKPTKELGTVFWYI